MDYTKFPHHRGPFSPTGDRQARFLDTLGAPWLHRQNADGSTSIKAGERLYVQPGDEEVDLGRLYISGTLTTGETGTFRTTDPRKPFRRVGQLPFVATGEDQGEFSNNSDGTAQALDTAAGGFLRDFDYRPNSGTRPWPAKANLSLLDFYRSRNGVSATLDSETSTCGPDIEYATIQSMHTASVSGPYGQFVWMDGQRTALRVFGGQELRDGDYWPSFQYKLADSPLMSANTFGAQQLLTGQSNLLALGPGRFLLASNCYRSAHRPTLNHNADNPVAIVQYTPDAGAAWQLSGTPALADEIATVKQIPIFAPNDSTTSSDGYAYSFNQAVYFNSFSAAAPLRATKALALMTIGYNDYANTGGAGGHPLIGKILARVKVVEVTHADDGCAITAKRTIFEGSPIQCAYYRGLALPTGDGMLFIVYDVASGDPDPDSTSTNPAWLYAPYHPAKVYFTSTGDDLTEIGTMPFPAYCTGEPVYIDKKTIACPMYADGAHWLYLSTDRMATWKRGSLIARNGVPPAVADIYPDTARIGSLVMANFRKPVRLRAEDGRPANLHPQAPWIMDCRYAAPE